MKSSIDRTSITRKLSSLLDKASLTPAQAIEGTNLTDYANLIIGAAKFPPGIKVIYLYIADNEIQISIYGKSLAQIKIHCDSSLKRLKNINGIKTSSISASILITHEGTDIDILSGKETSCFQLFLITLSDRWASKGVAAAVNAGGAAIIFKSTENPALSAFIGLAATIVGIVFEAIHTAWRAESWSWSESK